MSDLDAFLADLVYGEIQAQANGSERTLQSLDHQIGVSDLGHCREKVRRMILQEPYTDPRDKTAAWIGTVIGAAIEDGLAQSHPDWLFQITVRVPLPGGRHLPGHPDIVIPPGNADGLPQVVGDLKTKAQLATTRRMGQSKQQRFQLVSYTRGLIEMGLLDPTEPIYMADIFIDRSGVDHDPYVIGEEYSPEMFDEVIEWLDDVLYAVEHGEEASRDPSREFCWGYCEYASACRGEDTTVQGVIDDPEQIAAVNAYVEGGELERRGKRMKEQAKIPLKGVEGVADGFAVKQLVVGGGPVSYVREPSVRLDIRPVRKKK